MAEQNISRKEAMIFNQRVAQMSKALWKAVEKDWQKWIKPYELNINEHHILWIAFHLEGATISDIAKFGVMHVSTAFNFSKKLWSCVLASLNQTKLGTISSELTTVWTLIPPFFFRFLGFCQRTP